MKKNAIRAIAAAFVGALAIVPAAQAQDLRFELGIPDTSPFHAPLARFAEKLGEVGIDATVSNGSVLSLAEVCAGMRDGLVACETGWWMAGFACCPTTRRSFPRRT